MLPLQYDTLLAIFNAIGALGYYYVILYIHKVRQSKCECAIDWKQSFLLYASYIFTLISIFAVGFLVFGLYTTHIRKYKWIEITLLLSSIAYIIVSYWYIYDLEKSQCICSSEITTVLIAILRFLNGVIVTYGLVLFILPVLLAFIYFIFKGK